VVPIENVNRAAGLAGFYGEPGEQIKNGLFVIAAIQLVAGLNQHQRAANPVLVVIHGAGKSKSLACRFKIAMQVTNCNDSWRGGEAQRFLVAGGSRVDAYNQTYYTQDKEREPPH
jgi:hypothetical protein